MGCHPKPIDEVHDFSRGLLHHQAEMDHPTIGYAEKREVLGSQVFQKIIKEPWGTPQRAPKSCYPCKKI